MSATSISPAKLAANRANAQKSTGPKTAQGKAAVARNAIQHGLTSSDLLIPGESLEELEVLRYEYTMQIKPTAGLERTLFDELVGAAWKLRRLQRMETEAASHCDNFMAMLEDDKLQKKLDNLGRHKTRIERTYHRSLKELKSLQTNRLRQNLLLDSEESLPGLADIQAFSEQTHRSNFPARCATPFAEQSQPEDSLQPDLSDPEQLQRHFERLTAEMDAELEQIFSGQTPEDVPEAA